MTSWRDQVESLPVEIRIKAHLVYELASDRMSGQPVDATAGALRAVAKAEGIDSEHPWIDDAAIEISQRPKDGPSWPGPAGTGLPSA
ncbi:hypothetical protein E4P39_01435 [Blastococcus sp. CT_GayMR19]|uniref:hypothetical protein n=1 Tax=Blastococcus sp. CT_GayMR19 TaxID=2559608 RepID=UPI001074192F|nr:hypothetical protein [Blastococcus sp. CT_GayMR19]TFV79336.1 hypothetical protein E4P39_01435 [Blastococcus sp. CT_GayMR19]